MDSGAPKAQQEDGSSPSAGNDIRSVLVLLLVGWIVYQAKSQQGWEGVKSLGLLLWGVGSGAMVVAILVREGWKKPISGLAGVMTLSLVGWFWLTDSHRSWASFGWDVLGLYIGFIPAFLLTEWIGHRQAQWQQAWVQRLRPAAADLETVAVLMAGWVGLTVFTLWRQAPLPLEPQRFERITASASIVPQESARWSSLRIGVALSGGGFRAAVMHAGTLHALERLGLRVAVLSTVSGGSIIGAYYAAGGDPVAFKDAVAAGRFNLRRELLHVHNVLRLPFPLTVPGTDIELFPAYRFDRRDVQAQLLQRTLLRDAATPLTAAAPAHLMAATDLTFGLLVGLLPEGLVALTPAPERAELAFHGSAVQLSPPLSTAERVAISGAFPLAFPPAPVVAELRFPGATASRARPLLLADGGIADNSGLELLAAADRLACRPPACAGPDLPAQRLAARFASDLYLVSDAGAIFGPEAHMGDAAALARAFDVTGARAGPPVSAANGKPLLRFSAQDAHIDPGRAFRGERSGPGAGQDPGRWSIRLTLDPAQPAAVLDHWVEALPTVQAPAARQALRQWRSAGSTPGSEAVLHDALVAGMRAALDEFRDTSTLDDGLDAERVDVLFKLGQMLVYARWPELRQHLDRSASGLR